MSTSNYPNLVDFIKDQNRYAKFSKHYPVFPLDPSKLKSEEIKDLKNSIEASLSPENLHCDGEISYEEAMEKRDYLLAVHKELEEATGRFLQLHY